MVLYGCVEGLLFGVSDMGREQGDVVRSMVSRLNLFDFVGVDLHGEKEVVKWGPVFLDVVTGCFVDQWIWRV